MFPDDVGCASTPVGTANPAAYATCPLTATAKPNTAIAPCNRLFIGILHPDSCRTSPMCGRPPRVTALARESRAVREPYSYFIYRASCASSPMSERLLRDLRDQRRALRLA